MTVPEVTPARQEQNNPPHDDVTCRHCAQVPPAAFKRFWKPEEKERRWHLIGADLHSLPEMAHFITVLSFTGPPDAPTCYRGPLYAEIDCQDAYQALMHARKCLDILDANYGVLD